MNSRLRGFLASVVATGALAVSAMSVAAATFTGTYSLSGSAFADPGLVIQASPMSGSGSFDLNVGESASIWLFDVWTNEGAVNPDDRTPRSIQAAFTMTAPAASSGTGWGSSVGQGLIAQYGSLTWGGPIDLLFGNGGLLRITLSDATFNWGLFGLTPGQRKGASIFATATYVTAPAAVPLPAAGLGLLAGLGGLALVRRRKAAA